jgi:hypothetical protein
MTGVCGARMGLSLGLREHEWDFRAGSGSTMSGSLVAKWKAAGAGGGTS